MARISTGTGDICHLLNGKLVTVRLGLGFSIATASVWIGQQLSLIEPNFQILTNANAKHHATLIFSRYATIYFLVVNADFATIPSEMRHQIWGFISSS